VGAQVGQRQERNQVSAAVVECEPRGRELTPCHLLLRVEAVRGRVIVWHPTLRLILLHVRASQGAYASLKALLRYLRVEAVEGGVIVGGRHTLTHSCLQVVVDANSRGLPPPAYVSIRQHSSAFVSMCQHTCSAAACLLANPTSRYASTCTMRTHV
jgi:hypothetical protein